MTVRDAASWPTSVCSGHSGTRRSKSPRAICVAVFSTTRNGRNAWRMKKKPASAMMSSTTVRMNTWMSASPRRIPRSFSTFFATTVSTPSRSVAMARH